MASNRMLPIYDLKSTGYNFYFGTGSGPRTHTTFLPLDFESSVSTSSTMSPYVVAEIGLEPIRENPTRF